IRNGRPYFIKGVGGSGSLELLAASGGNSVRTWGADGAQKILDEAQKHGLTVTVGIWLGHKEQGFHYDDPAQVEAQFEKAKQAILKLRNHPALLAWGIGNEMEGYDRGDDPLVWKAVEQIAKFAKENDPRHPTMTVIAEIGGEKLPSIKRYCPDIDMVGINCYGGAATVGERYKKAKLDKPYVVTEFGPVGWWEGANTPWKAPIEPTSTEKAKRYKQSYIGAVSKERGLCLGSYAFVWGHKQEATATWFGMLLPDGSKLGCVDALTECWTGKPPAHPCPQIRSLELVGPDTVAPGSEVRAKLTAFDPKGDPLQVQWELVDEATVRGIGGAYEPRPASHSEAVVQSSPEGATIRIPNEAHAYRIFVTIRNRH
ncbi:MAG TPA: glycoside hydrolase family 2 TIM barrel-domain containing protein, partial [Isosphaeraceae bacterium]|nr:glycoside hydrolase family 2 TIM barrel-domain containing protein [Isosphaeraceae bacterium]